MRMAYLILAHENEAQLDRLLERLLPTGSPDVAIIHADRRSRLWQSLQRRTGLPGNVRLVPDPVAVRWGHWSQVAAIARLVREAHATGCDYAHLLSGADWPALDRETLVAQLAGSDLCHVEARKGHHEERMQTRRLDSRWLRLDPRHDRLAYAATWELRRISRWLDNACIRLGKERARPWGTWHYGSQWWTLPGDAVALLARELPKLLASGRLRGTLCSDEHVVPTLIAHAFPDRLADNRRFVRFPQGSSSPRLLDASDRPAIEAARPWFVRKVSQTHDPFFLALGARPC
jgi:hypothetical protein